MKKYTISVILQGTIIPIITKYNLLNLRKYLPEAEVVLSTWEDEDVSGLDYDVLVLNKDPGAVLMAEYKNTYNNLNRQLLSTQEGLKKASGKYVLKLRSDMVLTSGKFLEYFERFPKRSGNYRLFEHKVIIGALFSRYSIKSGKQMERVNIPFHTSDWWMFGLKEDLEKFYFGTELVQEPYFTKYFDYEENRHKENPFGVIKSRFTPEQYLCYSCFARNFSDIRMQDASDYSEEIMQKSRECLINNFIILEYKQSGIYLPKYPYSRNEKFSGDQYLGLYNFYRYENEYKMFCDKDYQITTKNSFFKDEKLAYAKLRVYKHLFSVSDKTLPPIKRLEHLLLGTPIAWISFIITWVKLLILRTK